MSGWHHLYPVCIAVLVGVTIGYIIKWKLPETRERYWLFGASSALVVLLSIHVGFLIEKNQFWLKVINSFVSLSLPVYLYIVLLLASITLIPWRFQSWSKRLNALTIATAMICALDLINTIILSSQVFSLMGLPISLVFRLGAELRYSKEEIYWYFSALIVASCAAFSACVLFANFYYARYNAFSSGAVANGLIGILIGFVPLMSTRKIHKMVRRFDKKVKKLQDQAEAEKPGIISTPKQKYRDSLMQNAKDSKPATYV